MRQMKSTDWKAIEAQLREDLSEERYRHTLGVTYTSCALAMRFGADLTKARLAGLLHDCAKCIPNDEKIRLCRENRVPVSEFELAHTSLLHAKLGPFVAEEKYGVSDPEVLSAIEWHTTGRPDMTLLEKIIFIADYIEPNRDQAPHLEEIRYMAFTEPDRCVTMIAEDTLAYLESRGQEFDPMTVKTRDFYRKALES